MADDPLRGAGHGGAAHRGRTDRAAPRVPQRGGAILPPDDKVFTDLDPVAGGMSEALLRARCRGC
ncbi:hypothetical protein ACFYON_10190 [Micromonospora sp. NPDC005686]|uniref:hypothetical protein n=1 Tax=unclassified Micromonospora TaxID=2617518 RepID=UPI0033BBA9F2